jgi:hypothetical protein
MFCCILQEMAAKTAKQNFRFPVSLAGSPSLEENSVFPIIFVLFVPANKGSLSIPSAYYEDELRYFTAKRKEIIMEISADALSRAGVSRKDCTSNPTPFPKNTPVAMAYIPFQQFGQLYSPEKGYQRGTIFPDLDKPWGGMMK